MESSPPLVTPQTVSVKDILAWLAEKKEAADAKVARYQGSEHEGPWRGRSELCREALKKFGKID